MTKKQLKQHRLLRKHFQWGTFGKYGNEQLKYIFLRDISDSHLLHILGHIKINNKHPYHPDTILALDNELLYRAIKNIFISDYINVEVHKDTEEGIPGGYYYLNNGVPIYISKAEYYRLKRINKN